MQQHGSEIAVGVSEGQILASKYRVERILGVGGMGVVVAALHMQLETRVALKFLSPEMLANEEAVSRFAREARAAAKVTNEHVARVLDVGTLENGAPYMVMEFLEGSDLREWLHRHGPLGVEQTVEFVLQACEAIAEAHGLGIIHRDLKPANLFCVVRPDGFPCIKVLDFGISKFSGMGTSARGFSMTRTATAMGSPFYMSPEQMESAREVDARTDIWAIGIILHELLTGEPPFTGETLPEVCLKIATRSPPPVRHLRPDVPEGIENIIFRCLQKDRNQRYESVAALAIDLMPYGPARSMMSIERITRTLRSPTLSATSVAPGPSDPTGLRASRPSDTMGALGHTKLGSSRRTKAVTLVLGGAAVVALGIATATIVTLKKRGPEISASPASAAVSTAAAPTPQVPSTAALQVIPVRPPPVNEALAPVPETDAVPYPTSDPTAQVLRPQPHFVHPTHPPVVAAPARSHGATGTPSPTTPRDSDPFSRLSPPM